MQNQFSNSVKYRSALPIWLFNVVIIASWLTYLGPHYAVENILRNLNISITMVFGSFVAGGTALGGGAVAFPVLTKIFGVSAFDAKLFSLAIQSFGMTAASVTILYRRIDYYKEVVILTIAGSLPGSIVGLEIISSNITDLTSKSVFSLFLAAFGVALWKLLYTKTYPVQMEFKRYRRIILPLMGFIGGVVSGTLGTGADITVFAILVLYFRAELSAATATSVIVMAATSVFSSLYSLLISHELTDNVLQLVFACIPIVIIGAPLGAILCIKIRPAALIQGLIFLIFLDVSSTLFRVTSAWF